MADTPRMRTFPDAIRRPALACALWASLATSLPGCTTRGAEAPAADVASAAAPVVREPLPAFEPGTSRAALEQALASWPAGHRFAPDQGLGEGWEWTGPDGMRVEAQLRDGLVAACRVSRTWGTGAPPVDAHRLPDAFAGKPLREVEAAIGAGLLVERAWLDVPAAGPVAIVETHRWAIHDRGVDTGLYLAVLARDGVVTAVSHRWSGK